MTLTEKIERVRELLARRDNIETELAELLGGSVADVPAPRANAPKPKASAAKEPAEPRFVKGSGSAFGIEKTKNKPHRCSVCGKTGHSVRTCPNARGMHPDKAKPDTTAKLTEEQYDDIRDAMHDRDFMSGEYSLTHKLPPREVNAAIRSTDYEDYLASR